MRLMTKFKERIEVKNRKDKKSMNSRMVSFFKKDGEWGNALNLEEK